MRRRLVSLSFALAVVLAFTGFASSQGMEFTGGLTYNTYRVDFDGLEADLGITNGFGFFLGGQYWVTDTIAVGGQIERLLISGDASETYDAGGLPITAKAKADGGSTGFLGTVTMDLGKSSAFRIQPFAAAGIYTLEVTVDETLTAPGYLPEETRAVLKFDSRFGGKVGVNTRIQLTPTVVLNAFGAYRFISDFTEGTVRVGGVSMPMDDVVGWDLSGVSVGAGVVIGF